MRASDRNREQVVGLLRSSYADGLLSLDTLDYRLDAAVRARTVEQLHCLIADLASPRGALRSLKRFAEALADGARETLRPIAFKGPVRDLSLSDAIFADGRQVVIGRSSRCDIVIAGETVSRRHALLRRHPGGWALRDLASTNGTWVVRRRVERVVIAPGQIISLGAQRLRLLDVQ